MCMKRPSIVKGGMIGCGGTKDPSVGLVEAFVKKAEEQSARVQVPSGVRLADLEPDCLRALASQSRAVKTVKGVNVICCRLGAAPSTAPDGTKRSGFMHVRTKSGDEANFLIDQLITA